MNELTITCTRCIKKIPLGQESDMLDYDNWQVYVFCQECYDEVYSITAREERAREWMNGEGQREEEGIK